MYSYAGPRPRHESGGSARSACAAAADRGFGQVSAAANRRVRIDLDVAIVANPGVRIDFEFFRSPAAANQGVLTEQPPICSMVKIETPGQRNERLFGKVRTLRFAAAGALKTPKSMRTPGFAAPSNSESMRTPGFVATGRPNRCGDAAAARRPDGPAPDAATPQRRDGQAAQRPDAAASRIPVSRRRGGQAAWRPGSRCRDATMVRWQCLYAFFAWRLTARLHSPYNRGRPLKRWSRMLPAFGGDWFRHGGSEVRSRSWSPFHVKQGYCQN